MTSSKVVIVLLLLIVVQVSRASEWQDMQMGKMESLGGLPISEQIEILGSIVQIGHRGELNEEHKAVLARSQSLLISIPGHAEYYEKKIKDRQAMIDASPEGEKSNYVPGYGMLQRKSFQILSLMPSPETVRVLGDFLSDEKGGWHFKDGVPPATVTDEVLYPQPRNCDQAAQVLFQLIDNPPVAGQTQKYGSNIPEWRLWYNQVKAGTRPIRFKGDTQDYNMNGPIRGVPNDAPRATKRPPQQASTMEASNDQKASRSNAPAITAIALAVLIGGGYWIYRRRSVT